MRKGGLEGGPFSFLELIKALPGCLGGAFLFGGFMPEREIINGWAFFTDPTMWLLMTVSVLGTIGRVFTSQEPIDKRVLAGETIMAGIGAVGVYAAGLIKGYNPAEVILIGVLLTLGGIHSVQRAVQVFQYIQKGR